MSPVLSVGAGLLSLRENNPREVTTPKSIWTRAVRARGGDTG